MKSIQMRLPCVRAPGPFHFPPAILAGSGIQSPDCAPTRSGQQIFGGWTAASHPARLPQHNLHYTQQGLWIPVTTRMTGWGSRILTAARITADDGKALVRTPCFLGGRDGQWWPGWSVGKPVKPAGVFYQEFVQKAAVDFLPGLQVGNHLGLG